jgi:hypothetical protein
MDRTGPIWAGGLGLAEREEKEGWWWIFGPVPHCVMPHGTAQLRIKQRGCGGGAPAIFL